MKILLSESQIKKVLKKNFNLDLTGKIKMITSRKQLPYPFSEIPIRIINNYLNNYGPMFLITFNDDKYLCQKMGEKWLIADENDREFTEFQFMKRLGIEVLGLPFDLIINEYFVEEINESIKSKNNLEHIIQSYLDMNLDGYHGIKKFLVVYNKKFDNYTINIFFDRQLAVEMGGKINLLIRKATNQIGNELSKIFHGSNLTFHQHFED